MNYPNQRVKPDEVFMKWLLKLVEFIKTSASPNLKEFGEFLSV